MRRELIARTFCFGSTLVLLGLLRGSEAAQTKSEPDIYPSPEVASKEIKAAVAEAARQHKRVLLDFGGNWCGDCRVLDKYFHEAANASLLEANFVLVHVNIGRWDKNKDIASRYSVPLQKGVPALAVLDSGGRRLYSQEHGEFESMRTLKSEVVTGFLNHWKGH